MKRFILILTMILLIGAGTQASGAERESSGSLLSLKQAHELALQNNLNIKQIGETVRQADILIWQAYGILMPNLSMNGNITRNSAESSFPDMNAMITNSINDAVARATGTQAPLLVPATDEMVMSEKWGKAFGFTANMSLFNARSIPLILNAYDNSEASLIAGRHQRNDLLFAVTAAYYAVAATKEAVRVAEADMENAQAFLRLAKRRQSVGQSVKIDTLQAEIKVMDAEKLTKNSNDALKLAKTSLSYLIGLKADFEIEKVDRPKVVNGSLRELQNRAMTERMDLKALKIQQTMADRNTSETYTKWVPSFDMTYKWDWNSATGMTGKHDSWMLIFGAKWSIFEGGTRIAEAYDRQSKNRQAEYSVGQASLDMKEEIEKNLQAYEQSLRNLELAKKQFVLAKESHRLIEKQYEQGMATSLTLLEAQNTLSNARQNKVIEGLNLDLAILSLNKSVGQYNVLLNRELY